MGSGPMKGKKWILLGSLRRSISFVIHQPCNYIVGRTFLGIYQIGYSLWYLGEDELCVVENGQWVFMHNSFHSNNLQLWDNPPNHILESLVQFSLFIMLETIGLENILCSLDTLCTIAFIAKWGKCCAVFSSPCCLTKSPGAGPPPGFTSAMLQMGDTALGWCADFACPQKENWIDLKHI